MRCEPYQSITARDLFDGGLAKMRTVFARVHNKCGLALFSVVLDNFSCLPQQGPRNLLHGCVARNKQLRGKTKNWVRNLALTVQRNIWFLLFFGSQYSFSALSTFFPSSCSEDIRAPSRWLWRIDDVRRTAHTPSACNSDSSIQMPPTRDTHALMEFFKQ